MGFKGMVTIHAVNEAGAKAMQSYQQQARIEIHDFRPGHFDEINLLMAEKANARGELQSVRHRIPSSSGRSGCDFD
jgi:hypothetical protein